jgi:hypothetical protein
MRTSGSSGSMALLSEYDDATARELRSLRLESTEDGKGILLIEVDERSQASIAKCAMKSRPLS